MIVRAQRWQVLAFKLQTKTSFGSNLKYQAESRRCQNGSWHIGTVSIREKGAMATGLRFVNWAHHDPREETRAVPPPELLQLPVDKLSSGSPCRRGRKRQHSRSHHSNCQCTEFAKFLPAIWTTSQRRNRRQSLLLLLGVAQCYTENLISKWQLTWHEFLMLHPG